MAADDANGAAVQAAGALAEDLRPALLRASRRLRREAQKAGLSALDAQLLNALRKRPGAGVAELAAGEQMTRPSMSGHLKRLQASGWVCRRDDAGGDRRRVEMHLTLAGEAALVAIRRRRNDWLARRLAALSGEGRSALAAAVAPLLALAADD